MGSESEDVVTENDNPEKRLKTLNYDKSSTVAVSKDTEIVVPSKPLVSSMPMLDNTDNDGSHLDLQEVPQENETSHAESDDRDIFSSQTSDAENNTKAIEDADGEDSDSSIMLSTPVQDDLDAGIILSGGSVNHALVNANEQLGDPFYSGLTEVNVVENVQQEIPVQSTTPHESTSAGAIEQSICVEKIPEDEEEEPETFLTPTITFLKPKSKHSTPRQYLFCPTRLNRTQLANVSKVCEMCNGKITKEFNENVSHLILNLENGRVPQTMKYLFAIAGRKWVVVYDWVEECLKQKKLVPEVSLNNV